MRYSFEDFALDTDRRELRRGSQSVSVEPQVFDLLTYLVQHRERVVSKDDLLASIWDGRAVSESALTTRVNAARNAIGDSGETQRLIKTLPRKGLRFVGIVREERLSEAAAPEASLPHLPERPSIAVLPFTNMSGDAEQEYFADGMAEEIITALSRCTWLFVIARNSSFTYKGKPADVRQVGRELGVRYVLEGSVRRGGDRLRFTGQLIDASSGAHIWADRFEGEITDVFELQDRLTEKVVAAIEPNLQLAEIERLKRKPADNLDAYDLLLRAQAFEYEFSEQGLEDALRCLKQALEVDPKYAPAMALAAYCYAERHTQNWAQRPQEETVKGLDLISRAIELGKDDANVLWKAAYVVRHLAKDARRAGELSSRSLLLNPNSSIALAMAGWNEVALGNSGDALELFRRAERFSPRDPKGWYIAAGVGHCHYIEGRFKEAATWTQKAVVQNPRSGVSLRYHAASLAKLGETERASKFMQQVLAIEPQITVSKLRARTMFMDEAAWLKYADGLRLAGMPE